jgi:hypothetical protein
MAARLLPCLLLAAALATAVAFAEEQSYPSAPPPAATIPVDGPQLRLARNQLGEVIELHDISDASGPYAGKYSDSDRWYFEHYVPGVTAEEEQHFGG